MARESALLAENVAARAELGGFTLPADTAAALQGYLELLMQWNRRMNLVGAHTWEKAFDNLVLDSFWLGAFLEEHLPARPCENDEIWDLGAGAGLPGIPLRLVWPWGSYWLVESREKRALFLSTVLARLSLPETHVFRGRVEDFMPGRKAAVILSRAFMPWPDLLELVRPYLAPEGRVILLSNQAVAEQGGENVPSGWRYAASSRYQVPGGGASRFLTALGLA